MPDRFVILTEGQSDSRQAKTAVNLLRYRGESVVAVLDSTHAGKTTDALWGVGGQTPVVGELADAPAADTLVIGIAPTGGKLPEAWRRTILEAIDNKQTVISGLHDFLGDDAEIAAAAQKRGARLVDVRRNSERSVARRQGIDESCLRIHTVANDCSLGKMVVSLELARALQQAGHDAKFVATGQTGIMIEGDGCPIDSVVADFVNGAAERLILANQHHKILSIEGQGSLVHPSYSAVTLGLLHGAMPDGLILCYEAGRKEVHGLPGIALPPLVQVKQAVEMMANLMHPCRVIAIAVNGRSLSEEQLEIERQRVHNEFSLPVCDVWRDGPDTLVDAVLKLKEELGK